MKKFLFAISIMLASAAVYAATAAFTGNMEQIQTVTGTFAWKCEYTYNGQTFWKIFKTSCPGMIEIE